MSLRFFFRFLFFTFITFNFTYIALSQPPADEVETVKELDIQKYLGLWYEIAAFPQRFQKDCTGVTAEYTQTELGRIHIKNSCFKKSLDGVLSVANAKGWIPDPQFPGRLKVQFFWPFKGDYWVIGLDPDYQWAIVGSPTRKYLWFLSRTPQISETLFEKMSSLSQNQGFDLTKLKRTLQKVTP